MLLTIDGKEVKIGDKAVTFRGENVIVTGMREPHKPSSTGRVYVQHENGDEREYFPTVIGAKWVEILPPQNGGII